MVTPPKLPGDDPATLELAALAHGLARASARRRAFGVRRVAAAPAATPRLGQRAGSPQIETHARPNREALSPATDLSAAAVTPLVTPRAVATRAVAPETEPTDARLGAARVPAPAPTREAVEGPDRTTLSAAATSGSAAPQPVAPRELARACADLDQLRSAVEACRACALGHSRTRSVFADGAGAAGVLFLGEAPGYHEDQRGVPFVGDAGQLLTDIITKGMGLDRARDVTICNVLKCRPPDNRDPSPAEKELCTGWLERELELVAPKLVIALGRHAAGFLLGTDASLGSLRGRVHRRGELPVIVTYHPAYLLRSPDQKKACWQDIQLAMQFLGLPLPGRAPRGR